MSTDLRRLITEYQQHVALAVELLVSAGIHRPTSNMEWVGNGIPQSGDLPEGHSYFKHGYGCAVRGPDWAVDFDFGDRGQIDGFCPHRLFHFAEQQGGHRYDTEKQVQAAVQQAVATGDLVYSGYILFYLADRV